LIEDNNLLHGADEAHATNQHPHDDFDWSLDKRARKSYSEEERKELASYYDSTFKQIGENEIIAATIVSVTDSDVVVDVGFKSDGLIPKTEFRDMAEIKPGTEIEVYVMRKEDRNGQLVLSRRNARLLRAWEAIVNAHKIDQIVTGQIISKTKGGLIVDVFGLETFLPGSQIDVKPVLDYDQYVGKRMEFKVVKINENIKNAVVSHKALIESDLEEQRQQIIAQLERGQVLEGTVKNITDFGAFIDLGGVDGLLYITDISWGRITHPSDVLQINQKINVVVTDFDDLKKRISLGLKQLTPHPWDVLGEEIVENSTVTGRIVNIEDYGAFLEITPGVEGLIHISEVSWSNQPINPRDYFKVGDTHEAKIVTLDRNEKKMSLSIKQLLSDPWENIQERFPAGSRFTGEVKNITPYGIFIELAEGIGGMVHISDISWTKRFNHPSEFTKIGEKLEVVVLSIDKEARKLSLGHKQVEEDPWDTFATIFPEGSLHEGTIIRRDDKGAIVSLPYGIEAFAPIKHLRKADGTTAQIEDTLTFKVIEFDRNEKRIVVSHSDYEYDQKTAADDAQRAANQQAEAETQANIEKLNQEAKSSKTTLGDLDVLAELKSKMDDSDNETEPETEAAELNEDDKGKENEEIKEA
jgi:small subunit ribosomal protein S1